MVVIPAAEKQSVTVAGKEPSGMPCAHKPAAGLSSGSRETEVTTQAHDVEHAHTTTTTLPRNDQAENPPTATVVVPPQKVRSAHNPSSKVL